MRFGLRRRPEHSAESRRIDKGRHQIDACLVHGLSTNANLAGLAKRPHSFEVWRSAKNQYQGPDVGMSIRFGALECQEPPSCLPSRPAAQPPSRPAAQPPSRPAAQPPSFRRHALRVSTMDLRSTFMNQYFCCRNWQ